MKMYVAVNNFLRNPGILFEAVIDGTEMFCHILLWEVNGKQTITIKIFKLKEKLIGEQNELLILDETKNVFSFGNCNVF
jgi:hypothetical protein